MILAISGASTKALDRVDEGQLAKMRKQLENKGEIRTLERRTLRDGHQGVLFEAVTDGPDGSEAVAYVLFVPQGERGLIVTYVVPNQAGDLGGWSSIVASLEFPSTFKIPTKVIILVGMLAAFGLLLFYAKRNPAPRRRLRSFEELGIERREGAAGAEGPSSPFGSGKPPGVPADAPTDAAMPQVPGLRSTIPEGGMWVDPDAGATPEPASVVPAKPDAPAAPLDKAAMPSVPGLRSTLGSDGQWDESKSYAPTQPPK